MRSFCRPGLAIVAILVASCLAGNVASAAGNDFSIQVSPSPLVVNPAPGKTQTATITIRNFSTHAQTLKVGLSGLKTENNGRTIIPHGPVPGNMDAWVKFSQPQVTVQPGNSAPLEISFTPPNNTGFSYAAAISLTSTETPAQAANGAAIKPEVDIFCLVNINRPDASAALNIASFTASRSHYNFLPATLHLSVANTGNVIEQPAGNIFIQRHFDDPTPIATLPINASGGYVLPQTSRTFSSEWADGFPVYVASGGKQQLSWDWKHVGNLRFGRYVAKAVLVYNNGRQDVPLIASYTFWVIPWWLLIISLLVGITLIAGLIGWGWLIFKGTKKVKGYAARHKHQK